MTRFMIKRFSIESFDKNDKDHLLYLKELMSDETVKERFNGLSFKPHLDAEGLVFDRGYFIKENASDNLIGYYHIGEVTCNNDVYLRSSTRKCFRNKGYGSKMLEEVTEYLCNNMSDIKRIVLKIDKDNIGSWKVASNAGYEWLSKDYCSKDNPNFNVKKGSCL